MGVGDRDCGQKRLGIGVVGGREDLVGAAQFDDMAQVHDHHPVRQVAHDRQVVADEKKRRSVLPLDLHQEVGHRRLNGHVECRYRFVRHHDLGAPGEGAGDAHALFLPARQLTRHPVGEGAGKLHEIQKLKHPGAPVRVVFADAEDFQRADDLAPHRHRRVERVERVLEHHLDARHRVCRPVFDRCRLNFVVVKHDLAGGRGLQPHQHLGESGLAATGFADDGQGFTGAGLETQGFVGLHHPLVSAAEEA